jgi:hypothetical protein
MMTNENRKPYDPRSFPVADYGAYNIVFADDLAAIQDQGTVTSLMFAAVTRPVVDNFGPERRIVVRLIVPNEFLHQIGRQLIAGA